MVEATAATEVPRPPVRAALEPRPDAQSVRPVVRARVVDLRDQLPLSARRLARAGFLGASGECDERDRRKRDEFEGEGKADRARVAGIASEVGLEVRAGVHTGECERTDGTMRGIAVHVAQFDEALDRFCDEWNRGTTDAQGSRWSTCWRWASGPERGGRLRGCRKGRSYGPCRRSFRTRFTELSHVRAGEREGAIYRMFCETEPPRRVTICGAEPRRACRRSIHAAMALHDRCRLAPFAKRYKRVPTTDIRMGCVLPHRLLPFTVASWKPAASQRTSAARQDCISSRWTRSLSTSA